jgi:uncharacterized membrane-anchored protein YitT (DUF2179 family)
MGFVLFTNPYKIIPGGVYGLGRVLHHLIPSIQTGTFGLLFDVPLTITAILVFGRQFGAKTIYAALVTPVFMNAMTSFLGEDPADGISIISTQFNFSDNVFFAALCGGLLIGVGCGLILRAGATSGGTDIISMLIVKFAKTKFSSAMFLVESTIVIIGMIVLGDWKLPLYSLISIFVCARAIDYVLEGASYDKLLFIISEKKEELKQYILVDMERGGTYIKSSGMYTGNDKDMIFLVISRREIAAVKEKIRALDPMAFVVVVDAYETYGDGFKPFSE